MDGEAVYQEPDERIMQLMRDTFGDFFKGYYFDDPIDIPKNNLPCIIIEEMAGRVDLGPTATDIEQTEINIRILLDKSADYNVNDNVDMTKRKIKRYIKARDPITGQYLPQTVLGALRNNITLGSSTIRSDQDWKFYLQPRKNQLVSAEGLVSIIVEQRIFVPNRT